MAGVKVIQALPMEHERSRPSLGLWAHPPSLTADSSRMHRAVSPHSTMQGYGFTLHCTAPHHSRSRPCCPPPLLAGRNLPPPPP